MCTSITQANKRYCPLKSRLHETVIETSRRRVKEEGIEKGKDKRKKRGGEAFCTSIGIRKIFF